jgi:hypothetical protein
VSEMRSLSIILFQTVILLFSALLLSTPLAAQVSQYSKDGISLSYPSGWALSDESDADSQTLALDRGLNEAKIVVMALRRQMDSQQLAEAQSRMSRAILDSLTESITRAGGQVERSSVSVTVGGGQANGIRLRTVLDGEGGNVDVYWLVLDNRLVHLILIGSDQALERASLAWIMVCSTLQVGGSRPPATSGKAFTRSSYSHSVSISWE